MKWTVQLNKGGGKKVKESFAMGHSCVTCIQVINLPWKKADAEKTASRASTLESLPSY